MEFKNIRFKELVEQYKQLLNLLKEEGKVKRSETSIEEGAVYEGKLGGFPIFLLAVRKKGELVYFVPLSFMWELATRVDMLIEFSHPLREVWIAQFDLSSQVQESFFKEFGFKKVGKVKDEDLKLIKEIYERKREIPKGRKGRGYEDEAHQEFKEIEYQRHKPIYNYFLNNLQESSTVLIPISFIKESETKLRAAGAIRHIFNLSFGRAIYLKDESSAELLFKRELIGKFGELYFKKGNEWVLIWQGEIPEKLIIREITPKVFQGLKELLKLEIE